MKRLFVLIGLCWLMLGCAQTKQYVPFPDQTRGLENPEYARFYVMRPTSFGSVVPMKIYDGRELIGTTGPQGYLSWEREPEDARIRGQSENSAEILIHARKGETYFIQQHIMIGLVMAENYLEQLSTEQGKEMFKTCRPPKFADGDSKKSKKDVPREVNGILEKKEVPVSIEGLSAGAAGLSK